MLTQLLRPGNVYGGIRDVPRAWLDAELFRNGLKLLIVRDPRDALVSEYYSNAYSHPIPAQNADHGEMAEIMLAQRKYAIAHPIDEYVVERASALVRSIMEYAVVARMPNTRMFRYEDVVFDKAGLIASIARHFGWDAPAEAVKRILSRVDVRPDKEDPQAFVRQVTPGDHRRKLERATIARLGELLWPAMNLLGYSVD